MKAVVAHRGARDGYEVAWALAERGLLDRLVTDLYWPADRRSVQTVEPRLPASARTQLRSRFAQQVPSSNVECCWLSGLLSFLAERSHRLPFGLRRAATRWSDAAIGKRAGRLACERGAIPVSYSYYGFNCFRECPTPGILFQLHPHPASIRRILRAELADFPETSSSLLQEWELGLPPEDFARLAAEPRMAHSVIAASMFTRETLLENGVERDNIHVVPYGVDHDRFNASPENDRWGSQSTPLRLLFVGRLGQRKGLTYLAEAIRSFPATAVELIIAGRPVDDLRALDPIRDRIQLHCSVPDEAIRHLYRTSDLFIFPSLAEGFGHVLLESLASGLPILTTSRTAGPDLITPGMEGWIVPPRRSDLLAERIEWALTHRDKLAGMRRPAYECARNFTWSRFRARIGEVFTGFAKPESTVRVGVPAHV